MFKQRNILKIVLLMGDVFLLYLSLILSLMLRHTTLSLAVLPELRELLWHFTLLFAFWLLLLYIFDFYERPSGTLQETIRNFITFLALALFSGVVYFYFRPDIGVSPKTILALTIGIFGTLMAAMRFSMLRLFHLEAELGLDGRKKKIELEGIREEDFILKSERVGKAYSLSKRLIDILAALIGFCVLALLFPVIALTIKLTSSGPVFYSQKRVGNGGKTFTLYKFRTMIRDAEKSGPQWAKEGDARVTKLGFFLRRTHLDELPQAFNLFKGDVSLVGPRPERPEFTQLLEQEIPHYSLRWQVKPGIMGWAQLNFPYGDSVEDAREKLKYDLYYIQNRSLLLDLIIVLKSLKIVIFAKGQ